MAPTRILFLFFGVFLAATAILMIKASTLPPGLLAASRLAGAVLILLPFWWRELRKLAPVSIWSTIRPSLLPGLFLGLHFISWNAGGRATLAGNASLLVNLVPLVMPFLAWTFLREHPTKREIVGTLIALLGVGVLAWGDYQFSPEHLVGDGLCFASMLAYSVYILLARKRARPGAMFTYLTPLYASGGLVCFAWALIAEQPFAPMSGIDLLLVAGLTLFPTLGGHSIANWAMTAVRAQTYSLINLSQFVFSGTMAFFAFHEVPHVTFALTAALVLCGAGVALFPFKSRKQPQP